MSNFNIRILIIGIILSQLFILSGCETYHLSNGKKYRVYFPVKDEHIISQVEMQNHRFNIDDFLQPEKEGEVQYVTPKDINLLLEVINSDVLLIFYFPNCSVIPKELEIAKFAEINNIPFLLISDTYSPVKISDIIREYDLKNKNQYVIPSLSPDNNVGLTKKKEFISTLCPKCYEEEKDDLVFASILIVSKNGYTRTKPSILGEFDNTGSFIEWIKEEFKIF